MDNEGLLEWATHEVARTKEILRRAEKHMEMLENKVKYDAAAMDRKSYVEKQLRSSDIPKDVWNNVGSINELLAVLIERREFIVGGGIRERILYE